MIKEITKVRMTKVEVTKTPGDVPITEWEGEVHVVITKGILFWKRMIQTFFFVRGNSTVWFYYPQGNRCEIELESILCAAQKREQWFSRYKERIEK